MFPLLPIVSLQSLLTLVSLVIPRRLNSDRKKLKLEMCSLNQILVTCSKFVVKKRVGCLTVKMSTLNTKQELYWIIPPDPDR